ncbi:MAG: GerAB/ArcD/ProY family transporter, partial [Clostridiales bacterium]|nr:GerAB/ArcD/ProY family transporter [Clostridiales bacterium]
MKTEAISPRNIRSLLILMVLCGSLVNGAFTVGQDTWIAVLLMGILFLPALLMYSRICALFPGKNLYDITRELFGRVGSLLVVLLMSLYALVVTALQLRNFT